VSHEFLPTYALDRAALTHQPDPDALGRAILHVGSDFPAVGAFLCAGWIAS
jgi:hypothetical protein